MHWAAKYVGVPYAEGARGPQAYDCWGIIQLIYRQEKGIVLPDLPGLRAPMIKEINDAIQRESAIDWKEMVTPVEGCVVAMGHTEDLHHVGIWIDTGAEGGKVLNSRAGHNVVVDTLRAIKLRGLRVVKFYKHKQWPG